MATAAQTVTQLAMQRTGSMGQSSMGGSQAFGASAPRVVATHQPQLAVTKVFQPGPHQSVPDTANVTGPHRFKYFKRPIIPFLSAQPPEVVFAPTQGAAQPLEVPEQVEEPLAKEMATQSDYRETEAQTDPFSPDYWVAQGKEPEVLSLASLTYANGLPGGLQEVKMIERARQKRAFEASFPPMTDESSLELRRVMMSEQEMREWNVREEEIKNLQDGRVEQFAAQLQHAAGEVERSWEDRVEHIRQIKLTEKDKALSAVQRRRIKALRKLSDARKTVDMEPGDAKRDIVRDYADYSSQVYAPFTRDGRVTQDKLSHLFEVHPGRLQGLDQLTSLEESLPESVTQVHVQRPPKEKSHLTIVERKQRKIRGALDHMDAALKAAKQAKPSEKEQKEALLAAYRVVKPLERPPTPQTEEPDVDDDIENAAVLLQRLIRGRAVQNMMFEGKERRLELIQELRAEEAPGLDAEEQTAHEAELQLQEHNERVVSTSLEALQAELVSTTLDFLSKELVRFREERKIAEMVRQVELTRRLREAEESGRRQVEMEKRDLEDAQWREVMRIYNSSADTYLSEIVSDAVEAVAARQAAYEVEFKEAQLDQAVARIHGKHDEAKAVVLDLVSSFLFPEVDRQHKIRADQANDDRYKHAADKSTVDAVLDAAQRGSVGAGAAGEDVELQ